jgi:hypothetical protein
MFGLQGSKPMEAPVGVTWLRLIDFPGIREGSVR